MRRISGLLLILLISFCGGNEIVEDPITTTTSMMTLEEYEKGWIEKLEIYPVLTKLGLRLTYFVYFKNN